jgi:hypothetical protein
MIYIQSNREKSRPHHFDCASALYGAIDSAIDYRLVSLEDVQAGKYDVLIKQNLFVGSVEFMREVFNRIGINEISLPENSDRPSKIISLFDAHKIVSEGKKIFIKPVQMKLFTGLVLDGTTYTCLRDLPGDTQVMCYEPFEGKILSEWRIYVDKGKIVDSKNYSGDFKVQPRYDDIEATLYDNVVKKQFPDTYVADFGVLEIIKSSGMYHETVVVEYNDMYSIGNYGLPNDVYLKLLSKRYFEIMRNYRNLEK